MDIWNNTVTGNHGPVNLAVAVLTHDSSRPIFFGRRGKDTSGQEAEMLIEIEQWDTRVPPVHVFSVPKECSNSVVRY